MILLKKIVSKTANINTFYKSEDEQDRLLFFHSIGAFIIAPIYTLFIYDISISKVYFYIGISYTLLFPLYVFMCWKITYLKNKLIYLLNIHVFCVVFFAFESLLNSAFSIEELFCFFGVFAVCGVMIKRWYSLLLFNAFVFLLLLYGTTSVDKIDVSKELITLLFSVFGLTTVVVLYFKLMHINSITAHSNYLERIMNRSGGGYVLFDLKKEKRVVDYNDRALIDLNLKNMKQVDDAFFKLFTSEELVEIINLQLGITYTKRVKHQKLDNKYYTQLDISVMSQNNMNYHIARINDVTNKVNSLVELEQYEKKYNNLYFRNKAGVFTLDKKSRIINCNQSFIDMFEFTVNKNDRLFSKENNEEWEIVLSSLGKTESSHNYQTQFYLLNGGEKTFVFNWYLDMRTDNVEGSVIDLTNIQKASKALKESEEKYRLIYEDSNDAILLLDGDKILDANRKTTQLFGLSRKDIINVNVYELSANKGEETERQYNLFKKQLINSRSTKFNWLFNGSNSLIEAEVSLIEIMLGSKVYYQCVIKNNTEQNRNLRAIEKNKKNLENILENNPEGIIIVREEKVLYINSETIKLIGNNINIKSVFTAPSQLKFNKIFERHLLKRSRENTQLLLVNKLKEELLMDITIVSTSYEEEEASLIIMKDVSVQNTLAKEKLRAELAEETNKSLAREITERINTEKRLEEQFLRTKAILDSSSNTLLLTLSLDETISSFNSHCKTYFLIIFKKKLREKDTFNGYFENIISPVRLRLFKILFSEIKKGKSRQFEVKLEFKNTEYWLEIFMNPIFDTEGSVAEISIVAHDISEKKKTSIEIAASLKEKEILLKEIHHRVKNNLQVISSILNLQSSFITDENTLEILQESRNRIRSMAIIHENLYRTEDFSSINFSSYLKNLTTNLISSYRIDEEVILKTDLQEVDLVLDQAIPCGLLVNELISNALKYAWKKGEKGTITIVLKQEKRVVSLEISDNGIGLPLNFDEIKTDTLGLQLVVTLVEQLDGEIITDIKEGTKYLIKFDNLKP